MADSLVLPKPERACRMAQASAENLNILGLPKKRVTSVPRREQLARTPELPFPKGKGTDPSSGLPDREVGESQREEVE